MFFRQELANLFAINYRPVSLTGLTVVSPLISLMRPDDTVARQEYQAAFLNSTLNHSESFELLSAERNRIAKAEEVQHYVIFHDKALQAMAAYFPTNKDTFKLMYGVGPAKTEKYADDFLPIIRSYCQEHGID